MAAATTSGTLSYAELKRVWLTAAQGTKYNTNWWASLMAAIGLAESNGDPLATNPNDNGGTQTSWGVWQISNGSHSPPSPNWASPEVNAQLAIQKLNGQGLSAWGTYTSGAYRAFLNQSTTAAPAGSIPAIGGSAAQGAVELTAAEQAAQASTAGTCALQFNAHLGIFFGHGPTVQGPCLVRRTQVRALMGGIFIAGGGIVALAGLAVLLATTTGISPGALGKLASRTTGAAREVSDARYTGSHRAP